MTDIGFLTADAHILESMVADIILFIIYFIYAIVIVLSSNFVGFSYEHLATVPCYTQKCLQAFIWMWPRVGYRTRNF